MDDPDLHESPAHEPAHRDPDPHDSAEAPGLLMWLQGWYTSHCDGDWEHSCMIRLETLDNPGWMLRIDLDGTELPDRPFERLETQRDEHDWVHAHVEDSRFEAACGPTNLSEVLWISRTWVTEPVE